MEHLLSEETLYRDTDVPFFAFRLSPSPEGGGTFFVSNHLVSKPVCLDRQAAEVLRLADGQVTLADIIRCLTTRFPDAGPAEVRAGVLKVFKAVAGAELVWWRRAPIDLVAVAPPQTIFCEITEACNLRCLHCVVAAGQHAPSELTTDRWLSLEREMASFGVQSLAFSGGEPLMHPDFRRLAERTRELGMSIQLATNGTLITGATAAWLREIDAEVQVSLDGSTAAVHDQMRPGQHAFEATLRGIHALVDAGNQITVGTVVTRLNLRDIPDIVKLAEHLGVREFRLMPFVPKGRGLRWRDLEISPTEMQAVSHYLFELRGKVDLEIAPLEFEDMLHEQHIEGERLADRRLGCDGAVGYGTITATGDLLPCHFFEGVRADSVRQRDFSEVWRKSRFLNYFRSLNVRDLHGQCQACSWLPTCGGSCRAVNFAKGDLFGTNAQCYICAPGGEKCPESAP